jgi:hypothetical protein
MCVGSHNTVLYPHFEMSIYAQDLWSGFPGERTMSIPTYFHNTEYLLVLLPTIESPLALKQNG